MSFYTSLSGLQMAQTDLNTISHNLANVSTNGFKKSRSEFADVIASNFTTDPRRAVGSGTTLQQNRQLFGEGSLITTGSSLDLAVSGDGFFAVKTPGASGPLAYTRNGSFSINPAGYVTDAQGSRLQAYALESDGTVPNAAALTDVKVPETSGAATATTKVALTAKLNMAATASTAAFDRANASTYASATSTTIYDAAGKAQTLTVYFVRDGAAAGGGTTTPTTPVDEPAAPVTDPVAETPAEDAAPVADETPATPDTSTGGSTTAPEVPSKASGWTVYAYVGDQPMTVDNAKVSFGKDGALTTGALGMKFPADATGTQRAVTLNLAGSTSDKQAFAVAAREQDGVPPGEFAGITVDDAGVVTASYSNGDAVKLGKVALANFANPTGLRQVGNSYWNATGISGAATMGAANENGFGKLMAGTIEGSNVDITEELVELIAAQRNFQANAKALDTASQISQTIFNIRS
jgi:flagellar hook protein FlgE